MKLIDVHLQHWDMQAYVITGVLRVCSDCHQSFPYQFFGYGQKPKTLVHVWMITNVWACQFFFGNPYSFSSQCWPTHGQAQPLILAGQTWTQTKHTL